MKLSAYISLGILIACAAVQAADAQDTRGARFNYAPNVWRAEHGNVPKGYGDYVEPAHNVQAGSMPSKNLLGLDPMMLSKPAATPPVTPSQEVSAQAHAPQANASYSPAFGKPVLAQMPVAPQTAAAKPYTPPSKPAVAAPAQAAPKKPVVVAASQKRVSAVVRPRYASAPEATAPKQVASYGDGSWYTPAPVLPSSGGSSARTEVSGKVFLHSRSNH